MVVEWMRKKEMGGMMGKDVFFNVVLLVEELERFVERMVVLL